VLFSRIFWLSRPVLVRFDEYRSWRGAKMAKTIQFVYDCPTRIQETIS